MKLKLNKKDIKADRGITLIALVITIIVLLILAGITVVTLTGDNGILTKVGEARNRNTDAEIEEEIRLAWNKVYMDSYLDSTTDKANALKTELQKNGHTVEDVSANGNKITIKNYRGKDKVLDVSTGTVKELSAIAKAISDGTVFNDDNTPMTDEYENTFIIPKGFKLSKDSAEVVTEGIVIEDATYTNTKGSEFVWIPVSKDSSEKNKIKATKNTTILLNRYYFDPFSGDLSNSGVSSYYIEKSSNNIYDNAIAKNIDEFKLKTNIAGGFWIGRYEARKNSFDNLTEVSTDSVYNNITQPNAAIITQEMYESNIFFESDLVNSYAWDTATLFLQEYDNRQGNNFKKYSIQDSINKSGPLVKGTVTEEKNDKICNVYDMASNCVEWTTETLDSNSKPCVYRGGFYSTYITSYRGSYGATYYDNFISFRPLIYIK